MADKFRVGEMVYIDDEGKAWRPNASVQGYDDEGNPIFSRFLLISAADMGRFGFTVFTAYNTPITVGSAIGANPPTLPLPFDEDD